jgi:hypothetical protein
VDPGELSEGAVWRRSMQRIKGVFVYSFLSFFSFAFERFKNWMTPKARSWKHLSMSFSASHFRNRRRKSTHATWTHLARPRATTRRGKQIILSTQWNDRDATRSTDPGRVNLKASYIASAFSTPRESTRPRTMTDPKVS